MNKNILITGGAGFIGSHLAQSLLAGNWYVTIVDSLDPFYDLGIKHRNLEMCRAYGNRFTFLQLDVTNHESLTSSLNADYDVIVHLAAKTGVRPSVTNPREYSFVNTQGTQNMLEIARERNIRKFIFSSSSSVYGLNTQLPWSEDDQNLRPVSPYACSKLASELLGHSYSELYGIQFLALRFFTVYGPRQRPDLAIHKFALKMLNGEPLPILGSMDSGRDYTYIDDVVEGIRRAIGYDETLYEVINIGNNKTISMAEMIQTLEDAFGIKAITNHLPAAAGDLPLTCANITKAHQLLNYEPQTSFSEGIRLFKEWLTEENSSRLSRDQIPNSKTRNP